MFDLHGALLRKQEHDCARLDAFLFRQRALTLRLVAAWLRTEGFAAPDPAVAATWAVGAAEADALERLYAPHAGTLPRPRFRAICSLARSQAYDRLRQQFGDPAAASLA